MGSKRKNIMLLPYFGPTLVKKKAKQTEPARRCTGNTTRPGDQYYTVLYVLPIVAPLWKHLLDSITPRNCVQRPTFNIYGTLCDSAFFSSCNTKNGTGTGTCNVRGNLERKTSPRQSHNFTLGIKKIFW